MYFYSIKVLKKYWVFRFTDKIQGGFIREKLNEWMAGCGPEPCIDLLPINLINWKIFLQLIILV